MTQPEHEKIMTISAAEFARTLRRFARPWRMRELADGQWKIHWPQGTVVITLKALPPLRAGALTLPRHAVSFAFFAMPSTARREFLARFDMSFHRGGG